MYDAVCASEICHCNRPARLIFDLDGTHKNIQDSSQGFKMPENKDEFLEEFCYLLTEYFRLSLNIVLKREEICCDYRSCQKDKWSYHVIIPNYFVKDWKEDMKNVLRGLLELDKKKWFGNDCLDFSLYGRWKVLGMVHSTKWKYLEPYVRNKKNEYKRFLPDINWTNLSDQLVHVYTKEQPNTLDIPTVKPEARTVTRRVGGSKIFNKMKFGKNMSENIAKYDPGPKEFRCSRQLPAINARSLLSCIYPNQHHEIFDNCITIQYCMLVLDDSELNYVTGLDFYLKHIATNGIQGHRRSDPLRCKPKRPPRHKPDSHQPYPSDHTRSRDPCPSSPPPRIDASPTSRGRP